MSIGADPAADCALCPRLVDYRARLRAAEPEWHNAPVAGWGDPDAWLLIVGLAPGVKGANRTGRPFTGDASGDLLFATLGALGLEGGLFITNAVACVPPANRPLPAEVAACRPFLGARLEAMPGVRVVVTLGRVAHESTVRALGGRAAAHPFAHGAIHRIGGRAVISSYHCSRYNVNTGRLTPAMFARVFESAVALRHSA